MSEQNDATRYRKGGLSSRTTPLNISIATYVVLGSCLILNSQVDSDGAWPLYAQLVHRGVRLYTDLSLPQQPFFILETSWWGSILGRSWLMALVPAFLHLALYSGGYFLIARKSNWPPWQIALVLFSAAAFGIGWTAYRFDDYRVVSDICVLYSTLISIYIVDKSCSGQFLFPLIFLLGILTGLAFVTRANDGIFLFLSCIMILLSSKHKNPFFLMAIFIVSFLLCILLTVFLTHDRIDSYLKFTLIGSASLKGGSEQVIFDPALLFIDTTTFIFTPINILFYTPIIFAAALPAVVTDAFSAASNRRHTPVFFAILAILIFLIICLLFFYSRLSADCIDNIIQPFFILSVFFFGFFAIIVFFGFIRTSNPRLILFIIPLGSLAAAAMSSGGKHDGIYGPVGLFIILLIVIFKYKTIPKRINYYLISLLSLIGVAVALAKIEMPILWDYYKARPMFSGREWIVHPIYGEMYIDRRTEKFFSLVCHNINNKKGQKTLLSIPYSYANYYCGIEAWHSNVQTFFDTSSASAIKKIEIELLSRPPRWIVYQRQPKFLRFNEVFFNHGRRLEHRNLNELIESQVFEGRWKLVDKWTEQPGDDWLLIDTAPEQP